MEFNWSRFMKQVTTQCLGEDENNEPLDGFIETYGIKFTYSSNGDGSYSVFYNSKVVAWCADKASAICLCSDANSIINKQRGISK